MSVIKSFSVGNGDMFYINHASDNFTVIDCCYDDYDKGINNFYEIKDLASRKGISRFISTHPDEDHIKGLEKYCDIVGVYNFYCVVNKAIKMNLTESFKKYCELRDSDIAFPIFKGCSRAWMNKDTPERDNAGIECLWPDVNNKYYKEALDLAAQGEAFNNISPIITYSLKDGVKAMWLGDMEKDFLEKIKNEIIWPEVDILFAPHHGRDSAKILSDILKLLNPSVIVIGEAPSEHLNYYPGYNTITQISAGDIVFDCGNNIVDVYVGEYNYSVDFLTNAFKPNCSFGHYIGSFGTKKRPEEE